MLEPCSLVAAGFGISLFARADVSCDESFSVSELGGAEERDSGFYVGTGNLNLPLRSCRHHLIKLAIAEVIPIAQSTATDEVLWMLMVLDFPAPQMDEGEDESICLAWDLDNRHLSVDVLPDGSVEWFYSDLDGAFEGEEALDGVSQLPTRFWDRMKELANDGLEDVVA